MHYTVRDMRNLRTCTTSYIRIEFPKIFIRDTSTQVFYDKMKLAIIALVLFESAHHSILKDVEELSPTVTTPLGIIEGTYDTSNGGRRYEAYKGIPFAHPPTGERRFRVAKSISPWSGVLVAKLFGPTCMQYNFAESDPSARVVGSEDCLYLNIYTPIANNTSRDVNGMQAKLMPVIFYIPGGAFEVGSGSEYGPKYLLDNDVTLITINYRLGPLGFLSTEDKIVPGNAGLKDQVIALRWVKDNIQYFGGDPSKITIAGQSAGAGSVHFHYLSKLTRGLFRGGMSLSGTSANCWSVTRDPLEKAKRLATTVGCSTDNIKRMVDCLITHPAEDIVQSVSVFEKWVYNPSYTFGPSIEKGGGEFTFIDRSPIHIIASGDAHDVPWITGVVTDEGLYPTAYYIAQQEVFEELENNWETIAPFLLDYNDTILDVDKPKVAQLIKAHYLGQRPFSRSTFDQIVQMVGDQLFGSAVENAAKSQAQANESPVYTYLFSYRGAHSLTDVLSGTSENFGVCHSDDLRYVFDTTALDPTTTALDQDMQKVLINLWVSFATHGKPVVGVEWPRLSRSPKDEYRFLHIAGPKEIGMESSSNFANKDFWQTINFE